MTRVVDGVSKGAEDARPSEVLNQPVVRVVSAPTRPLRATEAPLAPLRPRRAGTRLPMGRLDGVRPQMSARPVAAVQPVMAARPAAVARPMRAVRPAEPLAPERALPTQPSRPRRLPLRAVLSELISTGAWRRPAMASAMVLMAFVASGVVVRSLTASKSTARAEQVAVTPASTATPEPTLTPAPTLSPAPSATTRPATRPAVTAAPSAVPTFDSAQALVDAFVAQTPGAWGILVKDLKTGETASYDANRSMTSASLYKLFVAQRIYQGIDLGTYTYDQAAGGGTGRTIKDCLNIMITISDNGCGRALISLLGYGKQDQALHVEGYTGTSFVTPQRTSAHDVGLMFERIYNGTLATPDSNARFLTLLKNQRVNNRLPKGVPAGTVMAHKTGDLEGYMHDAGIVYGPKTDYLVVVMSGPWTSPGTAPTKFAKISSWLWNYFEN